MGGGELMTERKTDRQTKTKGGGGGGQTDRERQTDRQTD